MIFILKFHKFFFIHRRSEQFGNKIPFHEFAQRITYFFFISYKIDLSAHAENYNAQFYLVLFVFIFSGLQKWCLHRQCWVAALALIAPKWTGLILWKTVLLGNWLQESENQYQNSTRIKEVSEILKLHYYCLCIQWLFGCHIDATRW